MSTATTRMAVNVAMAATTGTASPSPIGALPKVETDELPTSKAPASVGMPRPKGMCGVSDAYRRHRHNRQCDEAERDGRCAHACRLPAVLGARSNAGATGRNDQ